MDILTPKANKILVSFVIPTYNSELYIEECISSILNQNYEATEIIIVDAKSTDDTLTILNKYETHITKIISENDDGIYDAINKGIRNCNGDLIKILNSDDALTDNSLTRALNVYQNRLSKDDDTNFIIMSRIERINLFGDSLRIWGKPKNLLFFENLLHPSWYVPKQVYENYGLYDLNYKIASDYEYFLRLKKNKVELLKSSTPYVKYREGGTSEGGTGKREVYRIKKMYKGSFMACLLITQINTMIFLSKIKKTIINKR